MDNKYSIGLVLVFIMLGSLAGCTTARMTRQYASVVQYLYPAKTDPVDTPSIPVLSLPLKVGAAFVPEERSVNTTVFPEKEKIALLQEVSTHFQRYPFVQSIELIPTAYLTPGGGFTNLDQIRSLFGIEVIALLSYDQVQFTDEGLLSLTYWTLVGAYIVTGEKNDTKTLMDVAVYHIPSRKLLFRAPGISHVKGSATPVNLSEQLRRDSEKGFREAARDLVQNLQEQLKLFQERVKSAPQEFRVTYKPGYTGGGSLDAWIVLLLIGMGGYTLWLHKQG
ncbi:MAG: rhombotarget lipoprotein [Nitrospinota bacterium]|nr:MAG: rhombotarget lipoprotein [Nitrospinota bacterium]